MPVDVVHQDGRLTFTSSNSVKVWRVGQYLLVGNRDCSRVECVAMDGDNFSLETIGAAFKLCGGGEFTIVMADELSTAGLL